MEGPTLFSFNLHFRVVKRFNSDNSMEQVCTLSGGALLEVRTQPGQRIADAEELSMRGGPFLTKEAATAAGEQARRWLLCTSAHKHLGVDAGGHELSQLGLRVFEEGAGGGWAVTSTQVWSPWASIRAVLADHAAPRRMLNADADLALELCALADHETSERARFLTLVTAVESLTTRGRRFEPARQLVESFVTTVQSAQALPDAERASLLGGLKELRNESIGHSCRALVAAHLGERQYGGKRAAQFFGECYSVRSRVAHGERLAVGDLSGYLSWLVADLCVAVAHSPGGTQ